MHIGYFADLTLACQLKLNIVKPTTLLDCNNNTDELQVFKINESTAPLLLFDQTDFVGILAHDVDAFRRSVSNLRLRVSVASITFGFKLLTSLM